MTRRRLGSVIAVRRLRLRGTRRPVIIRLGKPRRTGHDWLAPFEIRDLNGSQVHYSYGVDPLQALILALEGIRVRLDKSRPRLTWVGGPAGEIGFSRLVPDLGSPEFRRRIEQLIDREVERFVRKLERRHQVRLRLASTIGAQRGDASAAHRTPSPPGARTGAVPRSAVTARARRAPVRRGILR
jgi:hypothetical protein